MLTNSAGRKLTGRVIPEISPTHRFQWEAVQDCHVILYAECMVKLSDSAACILKLCDGEKNVTEIIEELNRQFPEADLVRDVYDFLEVAHENGWVQYT